MGTFFTWLLPPLPPLTPSLENYSLILQFIPLAVRIWHCSRKKNRVMGLSPPPPCSGKIPAIPFFCKDFIPNSPNYVFLLPDFLIVIAMVTMMHMSMKIWKAWDEPLLWMSWWGEWAGGTSWRRLISTLVVPADYVSITIISLFLRCPPACVGSWPTKYQEEK